MLELLLDLECACDHCGDPFGVTLHCAGAGLADKQTVAQVKVPCPHCHTVNQVLFSPDDGAVCEVQAERQRYLIPVPSIN